MGDVLSPLMLWTAVLAAAFVLLTALVASRRRNMHLWLVSYCCWSTRSRKVSDAHGPVDLFIAVCDHFEPLCGNADRDVALYRVRRWCEEYPKLFSRFSDHTGRVPQHTFFFPQDQYSPEYLELLAELCAAGFGDVDVHLHHDNDSEAGLRCKLDEFRQSLFDRHGLLRRDPLTGEIVYGFIHGNWALCNSRPDGRWCGVNNEIPILVETGCYADFTLPSAPSDTQTSTINSIYYARNCPGRRKSHDRGVPARVGRRPPDESLLMIQGPLLLDWQRRKWGIMPRIENGDLHAGRPATAERLNLWMKAAVHVAGKPDWLFVKLHTHGAKPGNIDMLLSHRMQDFHSELARRADDNPDFRFHYVTAWEMSRLVHQAENGATEPKLDVERFAVPGGV